MRQGRFRLFLFRGKVGRRMGVRERQPHEYVRDGTAKLLTLFHPHSGAVRGRGVTSCPNVVLHAWLKEELSAVPATISPRPVLDRAANREFWQSWQQKLQWPITLPEELPSLRMLLVLDNLAGHKTPELALWMFSQGVMPLYTPLSGSWLNICESERADHQATGIRVSAPTDNDRDHPFTGSDSQRLESRADAV
jgi:hypothetical protein